MNVNGNKKIITYLGHVHYAIPILTDSSWHKHTVLNHQKLPEYPKCILYLLNENPPPVCPKPNTKLKNPAAYFIRIPSPKPAGLADLLEVNVRSLRKA